MTKPWPTVRLGEMLRRSEETMQSVISPPRRVRRPGLQKPVGRVPSRGDTSDVMFIELQPAAELLANGCNLDRKNPRAKEDITHLPPDQLAESILEKEKRIAHILGNIKNLLARKL